MNNTFIKCSIYLLSNIFRWILNVHICYGHLENKIYKVYNYMFLNTTVLICMNNKILNSQFLLFLRLWFWLPWNVNKHIHFFITIIKFHCHFTKISCTFRNNLFKSRIRSYKNFNLLHVPHLPILYHKHLILFLLQEQTFLPLQFLLL